MPIRIHSPGINVILCDTWVLLLWQVLVEAGADLLAKDALGLTPLDLADKMEHTEVMEILRGAVDRQASFMLDC